MSRSGRAPRPLGYEVIKAFNGEDAIGLIDRCDTDLVLLDVMMPGISGFEVCRIIKSREKTRMIPVVMVTAMDDLDSRIKAIEAGADDFITKPPNKLELLTRTKSLIRLKHLNNRLINIENVLFSLANAVEAKDAAPRTTPRRVSWLALSLEKGWRSGTARSRPCTSAGSFTTSGKSGFRMSSSTNRQISRPMNGRSSRPIRR